MCHPIRHQQAIKLASTLTLEGELPSPLGGDPIPLTAVFLLKSVDKDTGEASITWKQTADPEVMARMIDKRLKELGKQLGKPVDNADQLKTFSVEDTGEFSIDVATGWLHSLKHTRTMKTGDRTQVDTTTITRIVKMKR